MKLSVIAMLVLLSVGVSKAGLFVLESRTYNAADNNAFTWAIKIWADHGWKVPADHSTVNWKDYVTPILPADLKRLDFQLKTDDFVVWKLSDTVFKGVVIQSLDKDNYIGVQTLANSKLLIKQYDIMVGARPKVKAVADKEPEQQLPQ